MAEHDEIRALALRLAARYSGLKDSDLDNASIPFERRTSHRAFMDAAREAFRLGARMPETLMCVGGPRHGERLEVERGRDEVRLPLTPDPAPIRDFAFGKPVYAPIRYHVYRVRELAFAGRFATDRVLSYEGER